MSGCPALKSAKIGRFLPFFCLFRPFPGGAKSTWKIQKTEGKCLFPQISSDLLNPHLLNPHLWHSNFILGGFFRVGSPSLHFGGYFMRASACEACPMFGCYHSKSQRFCLPTAIKNTHTLHEESWCPLLKKREGESFMFIRFCRGISISRLRVDAIVQCQNGSLQRNHLSRMAALGFLPSMSQGTYLIRNRFSLIWVRSFWLGDPTLIPLKAVRGETGAITQNCPFVRVT